jgi:hypothetical protein
MLLNFLGAVASNFEVTADSRDTILIVNFTCHRYIKIYRVCGQATIGLRHKLLDVEIHHGSPDGR